MVYIVVNINKPALLNIMKKEKEEEEGEEEEEEEEESLLYVQESGSLCC